MPRAALHSEIEAGLRAMPPDEAISTALKLAGTLAAGIALLGLDRAEAHPANRVFDELHARILKQGSDDALSIDELVSLIERLCFQIWSLAAFQADPLNAQLRELVEPVSNPPATLIT